MKENGFEAIGGTLGLLMGIFVFYCVVWWLFYPNIGTVCDDQSTVKSISLTGRVWLSDYYTATFTDGTQATTGYHHKIGDTVCLRKSARLFPWF